MLVFRNDKLTASKQYEIEVKVKMLEGYNECIPLFDTEGKLCAWKLQRHLSEGVCLYE